MKKSNPPSSGDIEGSSGLPIWVTEPFRVFFPLGAAVAVFGVLVWPGFYWGIWPFPPHFQHPRLLIFGFGFAFVCGFLGTAWPKFLESKPLNFPELVLLIASWISAQVFYGCHRLQAGDLCFAGHALLLFVILSLRLRNRRALPPPGFALAFLTVLGAASVALFWAVNPVASMGGTGFVDRFAKLLAWQGLLTLPILGVGSYLFPRFFPSMTRPESHRRALGVWLGAGIVLLSFVVEAAGLVRTGNGVRFVAITVWSHLCVPGFWRQKSPTTRALGLKIGMAMISGCFLIRAFYPGPGYALEHLLLIGGFGLVLLLVADRVSHGHRDRGDLLLRRKSNSWRWILVLVPIAAATRASADFKASILVSHHIYAALLWAITVVLWLVLQYRSPAK